LSFINHIKNKKVITLTVLLNEYEIITNTVNKFVKIGIGVGVGVIIIHFTLAFFGFYITDDYFCNNEFHFQYDKQDDYTNPIKQVQQYLLKNYDGEINVNDIGGYWNEPPKSDPSRPITYVIQINDRLVKNSDDIDLMKESLEKNLKINNLTGPFHSCPTLPDPNI